MDHYDGPAFLRRHPEEPVSPSKPQKPHPQPETKSDPTNGNYRSVDPLKQFSTPRSVQNRYGRKHQTIDYTAIKAALRRDDTMVYLFTDEPATEDAPVTSHSAPLKPAADPISPVQTEASAPASSLVEPEPITPAAPVEAATTESSQAVIEPPTTTIVADVTPAAPPSARTISQAFRAFRAQKSKQLPPARETQPADSEPPIDQPVAPPTKPEAPAVQDIVPEPDTQTASRGYEFPSMDLLSSPVKPDAATQEAWVEQQQARLDDTLQAFNVDGHVVDYTVGPTVTQFQVALASGVKVNKITNLNDDLKLALAARDIRIEAPIPGKRTVGIEIPNLKPRPVMLKEVLASDAFREAKSPLTIALGVNLFGQPVIANIGKMPHGLIAGATGSGKSVFINSLLTSLLYKATPQEVRLLLIDPKAVELAPYNGLPHLVSPVISDAKAAAAALKWAVDEMENRYERLAAAGVRNLEQYNDKARERGDFGLVLPYIVIIIDELADLMMIAASEVQDHIARITQKARAAGIHLIVATQRPSVDVITGTIKNNIPTRLAFMVASQVDSRTIIDQNGAERLLGRGDMLFLGSGASQPIRLQGTFVDEEVTAVVDFVKRQQRVSYLFQPDKLVQAANEAESQDELFPDVLNYLATEDTMSTSKLQRAFSIGYNRAANMIDELEAKHLISPANGAKPRDVYLTPADLNHDANEEKGNETQ
ncbi:DNA translocase FtsK [Lacticaseibacillus brantae]|uniref:DNA translocase FtsK n=1 Tax=Lacticaseibacillus brantae DSM 23927 TaxID=1423727 RepID=A0A0R2B8R2_9LACO|nr:DNA translocase FtsK [Lacticaseibacillus brantae]KRM72891.1 DNA segregation ATPase FtsK SpoIIIE related protein [Lacticaseibacillus brantae DSM 23927]